MKAVGITDILFNVVFGNITAEDMRFVLYTSGVGGLQLAISARHRERRFY